MPAGQPFDERHLRDVVLAQSDEIRATQRFSGLHILSRPVVALAAIVAIVAISLGIKDYVGQNASSPAGTDASTVEHTNAITRPKKSTSGRAERTRASATEATGEETAQSSTGAAEMEKPLIAEESAGAGAQRTLLENNANALTAQAAHDEREALDRDDGIPNGRDTIRGSSACLPLPNGTRPEDVDAPYYFGWATEYCGHDLSRPSAHPKGAKSQPLKK